MFLNEMFCQLEDNDYLCNRNQHQLFLMTYEKKEAMCFILVLREPENSYRSENKECCTDVSAFKSVDFCHIPFSRFLRTSVGKYEGACASFYGS